VVSHPKLPLVRLYIICSISYRYDTSWSRLQEDEDDNDDDDYDDNNNNLFICKTTRVHRVLLYLDISVCNTYLIKFMEIDVGLMKRVIGCMIDRK